MFKSFFLRKYSKYLLFTLLFLVGILFYLQSTSPVIPPATVPANPPKAIVAAADNKPLLPNGYIVNKIIRDPFKMPSTLTKQSGPLSYQGGSKAASYEHLGLPVLTGIVKTDNYRVAILEYNGKSRYHRLQDKIGPYQLVAISDSSVTLYSANGRQVLPLRR